MRTRLSLGGAVSQDDQYSFVCSLFIGAFTKPFREKCDFFWGGYDAAPMDGTSHPKNPSRHGPVSVIIPVYNEVENLRDLQAAVTRALDSSGIEFEVILVNDGSTDGSTQLLDEIYRDDSRFRVVHFIQNYGQTAAMKAGIRHSNHDVLVSLDADLQNDPADIPAISSTTTI